MKVDVTDLLSVEDKAFEQKVETELTSFQSKLGEFPIIRKAPFVLHLENHKKRYIKVTGTTDVVVVVPCDRCLKGSAGYITSCDRPETLSGGAGVWRGCR